MGLQDSIRNHANIILPVAALAIGYALVTQSDRISKGARSLYGALKSQEYPNTGTQVMVDTSTDDYTHFSGGAPSPEGSSDNYVLSDRQISLGSDRRGGDAVAEEGKVQMNSFLRGPHMVEYGLDSIHGEQQSDNIRGTGRLGPSHDHYASHQLPDVGLAIRDSIVRGKKKKEFAS